MDPLEALNYPIVAVPSTCETPEAVIRYLVARQVAIGDIPEGNADAVIDAVLHRERLGSTNLGRGAALPHARLDSIERLIGIVGRLDVPIAWPEQMPNDIPSTGRAAEIVILSLAPNRQNADRLRELERIVRMLHAIDLNRNSPE